MSIKIGKGSITYLPWQFIIIFLYTHEIILLSCYAAMWWFHKPCIYSHIVVLSGYINVDISSCSTNGVNSGRVHWHSSYYIQANLQHLQCPCHQLVKAVLSLIAKVEHHYSLLLGDTCHPCRGLFGWLTTVLLKISALCTINRLEINIWLVQMLPKLKWLVLLVLGPYV